MRVQSPGRHTAQAAGSPHSSKCILWPIAFVVKALTLLCTRHVCLALLRQLGGCRVCGGELGTHSPDGSVECGGGNGRGGRGWAAIADRAVRSPRMTKVEGPMRVQRSMWSRRGCQAEGSPAMMTLGVAGGAFPSSMAAQRSQIHCAAGNVSGQCNNTWLVVAMVCGIVVSASRGLTMRHAGQRQHA